MPKILRFYPIKKDALFIIDLGITVRNGFYNLYYGSIGLLKAESSEKFVLNVYSVSLWYYDFRRGLKTTFMNTLFLYPKKSPTVQLPNLSKTFKSKSFLLTQEVGF